MSRILDLLFHRRQKFNPRAGSLAREAFFDCIDTYMKENGIERSDLDYDGPTLVHLYVSYKDEEINQLFKDIDENLPDIQLP